MKDSFAGASMSDLESVVGKNVQIERPRDLVCVEAVWFYSMDISK